jgi:2-oxoglutarate dehydrogenase E2 component (dihydrolipoamide succinyltransferase)
MIIEVELPDMGDEAADEARISEWYADEGDRVQEGQVLVEVSYNGNTFDVLAPASGTLLERLADEEDIVHVGDVLAVIECTGVDTPIAQEEEEEEE